jgi:hypothetical protein
MSFGRFVWMLHQRALWLSRADLLGDDWEMACSMIALQRWAGRWTSSDWLPKYREMVAHGKKLKEQTYVNCWTGSDVESHAMWSVYCPSKEGIAVRTTRSSLARSVKNQANVSIVTVDYRPLRSNPLALGQLKMIARKRPEYSYENETRIVLTKRPLRLFQPADGEMVAWDPEKWIEEVVIHPGADDGLNDVVTAVVQQFAPALERRIRLSRMGGRSPY